MIQTTLGIEGMMCSMCETHINDAIRRNFNVRSAKSDRKKKRCIVVSEEELDRAKVAQVVGDLGYELTSVTAEPYVKKRFGFFSR